MHTLHRLFAIAALSLSTLVAAITADAAPAFVQRNYATPQTSQSSVGVSYTAAQSAGNLNVVVVGWNDTTATVQSVTDSLGNTYVQAAGPTMVAGSATQSIYYAINAAAAPAGGNTVTVQFNSPAAFADIRIAEYSGIAAANPVDVTASATGSSATANSGAVTTSNANDLIVGANVVQTGTSGAGSGFTNRVITSPDGDILEDRIVTATGSYSATASLAPAGWWVMQMVAFRAAGSGGGDTQAPTAPGSLSATAASAAQINLTWTASTDNVGVSNYRIERCQGSGCTTFAQVGTMTGTTYSDGGLSASTTYSYRVRAADAAGNLSAYSNTASATTQAGSAPTIAFVQRNFATPQTSQSSVGVTYTAAQTAGNLNVVVVGWNDTTATVQSVTDSLGNTYARAVGPTMVTGSATQSIYYVINGSSAPAGGNTVTVQFSSPAAFADIRIAEYSGIAAASPVDVTASASGNSATSNSGAVTTSNANDLIVGANVVQTGTSGAGSGFTNRVITTPDGDILEDRIVTATGSYSATASLTPAGWWVMQMVAFRAAGSSGGDTQAPTAPGSLSATAASTTQINLTWTASTDNVGVSNYRIERCQGSGCTTFVQVGTSSGTTYSDVGLTASTNYSYRVRAADAAGNLSAYSGTATALTLSPDTQAPTAPGGLGATATSSVQIALTWVASSDNVGVTNYLIERCSGASCSNFAQIATSATTGYTDSGLSASTSYSYRVRATDAAGNLSAYSATATAATPAAGPDIQPPTVPTNLAATPLSSTQINLTWTASTDNVGVASYLVERCQGTGCTSFSQIATTTGTSFRNDVGLTASTTYTYRVRATDAAGNLSDYSSNVSATTLSADTQPPTAPTSLVATAVSAVQINLTWSASTDNIGVTGYLVESCSGSGCTNFVQIAASSVTSFSNSGLNPSTSYSYRVRAKDAAGNLGTYSTVASASTQAAALPAFVQVNSAVPQTAKASVAVAYTGAQAAGNLNVVVVGWNDATAQLRSVTDARGNVYTLAVGPTQVPNSATQAIYYSAGIAAAAAGANTVTATFDRSAAFVDMRIAEYSGIDPANPVDVTAEDASTSAMSSSGLAQTQNSSDLLVGANLVATGTLAAGAGFTSRVITSPDGDILEDRFVTNTGAYSASATLHTSGWWIMQMVAFRAATTLPPDSTPPSVSVTAPTAGSTASGTVTLKANSSDAGGVAGLQFQVDGINVGPPVTGTTFSLSFNTAQFGNGTHVITAYSWDNAGNIGTSSAVSVTFSNASAGNPAQTGYWSGTLTWPFVAINANLMYTGNILMWDGQTFGGFDAKVWNIVTGTFTDVPSADDIFCTGNSQLPDGRIFVTGGHIGAHIGLTAANIFDPKTLTWKAATPMSYARWYPTNTELPDGTTMVTSGETNCDGCYVPVPEIYNATTNTWTQLTGAQLVTQYYPYNFVLSDGRVLAAGTVEAPLVSKILDAAETSWSTVAPGTFDGGSAVMYLPNKILKTGTSANADAPPPASAKTAYVLDMTQATPAWRQVTSMAFARTYHTLTSLPDGTVLVTGGDTTAQPKDIANAVLQAELWSPTAETWTTLASMHAPRLYHSTALLLPDARVLITGGGRWDGSPMPTDQLSAEIFAPPYLFKGARPRITSAPATLSYGQGFTIQTPDAASIASVSLIALGSVTHTNNMSQRFLPLSFTGSSGSLTVTAPANSKLAPPGYYMLFIVNTSGVPSVSTMVRF